MNSKTAVKTDTKKTIEAARQAMSGIKKDILNEEYSDAFKAKVLDDLEEVEQLAKRIKEKFQD